MRAGTKLRSIHTFVATSLLPETARLLLLGPTPPLRLWTVAQLLPLILLLVAAKLIDSPEAPLAASFDSVAIPWLGSLPLHFGPH